MHVTSPDYPLASNAAYTPSLHSLDHAMKFEKTIGVPNIVLVQPSIYGNDNSCLLDALKEIGPIHGRGVVGFDPDNIDSKTLQQWHEMGVRGVRINLKSTNAQFTQESLRNTLQQYAKVLKPFNWVVELFIGMESMPQLLRIVPDLGVKVCIAHFGAPNLKETSHPYDPFKVPGFEALAQLLRDHKVWVKFSGAYRFDSDDQFRGIEPMAKELLGSVGDRIVFASDWPHTRFEGLDVKPFVMKCLDWTEEYGVKDAVFRDNTKDLWNNELEFSCWIFRIMYR